MSAQTSGGAGAPAPRTATNGTMNGSIAMPPQSRPNDGQLGGNAAGGGSSGAMSQQNLNSIVRLHVFSLVIRSSFPSNLHKSLLYMRISHL